MIKKINGIKRKLTGTAGVTLIELMIVIAILGALSAVAVPRLRGFITSAEDRTNDANAKLLTDIAQMIEAQTGCYPDWSATFSVLTTADSSSLMNDTITYQGTGHFSYNAAAGTVTAGSDGEPAIIAGATPDSLITSLPRTSAEVITAENDTIQITYTVVFQK